MDKLKTSELKDILLMGIVSMTGQDVIDFWNQMDTNHKKELTEKFNQVKAKMDAENISLKTITRVFLMNYIKGEINGFDIN